MDRPPKKTMWRPSLTAGLALLLAISLGLNVALLSKTGPPEAVWLKQFGWKCWDFQDPRLEPGGRRAGLPAGDGIDDFCGYPRREPLWEKAMSYVTGRQRVPDSLIYYRYWRLEAVPDAGGTEWALFVRKFPRGQ
jgi:hypothetical protein